MKDEEIEVLGQSPRFSGNKRKILYLALGVLAIIILTVLLLLVLKNNKDTEELKDKVEAEEEISTVTGVSDGKSAFVDTLASGIVIDTVFVDSAILRVFRPYNVRFGLTLDEPDTADTQILFVVQAANVREDNHKIIGDFIVDGEEKANRLSSHITTQGFCAIIGDKITIGRSKQTDLYEEMKNQKGCFFRQLPLVVGDDVVDYPIEGKSIRRALCLRNDTVIIVESISRLSVVDFAKALNNYEVSHAISLLGGKNLVEWYRGEGGSENVSVLFVNKSENSEGRNYLVARASKTTGE